MAHLAVTRIGAADGVARGRRRAAARLLMKSACASIEWLRKPRSLALRLVVPCGRRLMRGGVANGPSLGDQGEDFLDGAIARTDEQIASPPSRAISSTNVLELLEALEHVRMRDAAVARSFSGQRQALAAALAARGLTISPARLAGRCMWLAPSAQPSRPERQHGGERAEGERAGSQAASHGVTKPSSPMVSEMPSTMK